ncbi:MAG TPA: MATE family efflux transporter, partial [Gemmatimonadaceae bacterium]
MSLPSLDSVASTKATTAHPWRGELAAMARLALPIVLVQVGLMLPGFVDTLMVGRVSPRALAAVALANLYFFNVIVGAQGTLMAL